MINNFVHLFQKIDATNSSNDKVSALVEYFSNENISDKNKVWTIAVFTGNRPKRAVKTKELKQWVKELAQIPDWLFTETYGIAADLAETIALLVDSRLDELGNKFKEKNYKSENISDWISWLDKISKIEDLEKRKNIIFKIWTSNSKDTRFLFNKLITGGFRIGVGKLTMTKALAKYSNTDAATIQQRIMTNWKPKSTSFNYFVTESSKQEKLSQPYPFYLAYPLDKEPEAELGDIKDWQIEWKFDGIRGELIYRGKKTYIWSRGEELITQQFPELNLPKDLPIEDFVIDGEIMAYSNKPLNFNRLQKRLGRKKVSKKLQSEIPIKLIAYDLLEYSGEDLRKAKLTERRDKLKEIIALLDKKMINLSPILLAKQHNFANWAEARNLRKKSREFNTEGFMLKRKDSIYKTGRKRGEWWKWKIEPFTIDGILLYAKRGSGRRANLYTDYTFAVWETDKKETLVPFAKAYSGLTDAEIKKVDKFIKDNTKERFGPVRSVSPKLVFEIAFEGIRKSSRHKSGISVRFPRIKRWRHDKSANNANTLIELRQILDEYETSSE